MMKKIKKNITIMYVILLLIITGIFLKPVSIKGAVKMPAKSYTLVKNTSSYITKCIIFTRKKTWTKIDLNNKNCFDAIAYLCMQCDNKYIFKSADQLHAYCYNYFGKVGYKDVTTGDFFYYSGNKIVLSDSYMGDWGCSRPVCKITKKKKIKNGTYDIYVNNYLKTDEDLLEPGEKPLCKEGESIIRIKKNTKSRYGYVVSRIKYRLDK